MAWLLGVGCTRVSAGIAATELVSLSWLGSLNVACNSGYFSC